MKKQITAFVLLLIFISASYAQQAYVDTSYSFSINFPDGWKVKKGVSETIVVSASASENIEINIGIQGTGHLTDSSLKKMGLEKFVSSMEDHFKTSYQGYVTLKYGETNIDSLNTYYITYNISDEKVGKMHGTQFYFVNNKRLYVITEGCPELLYASYENTFDKSVNSFHFIK